MTLTRASSASLRQLLTIPYVVLVIIAAAVIGSLSYLAGRNAVDSLSNIVLSETVSRIAQAVDKHIAGSEAVLETAFPDGIPAPDSITEDLDRLRMRFWLATSIHRNPNNYAYYGDRNGQFFGLYRLSEQEAELRLRLNGSSPRSLYRYNGILGKLDQPVQEDRLFEPRDRPWYKAGQHTLSQTWTSIYIDFRTLELVSTRARRVSNVNGEFQGVVATDLSLQLLSDFLHGLTLTANGTAFIVELDGKLVATSRGPYLYESAPGKNTRLNAADSEDPLIAATYRSVKQLIGDDTSSTRPLTGAFEGPDGETVQTGYVRLRDDAGLDWLIAVAVPRNDFMFDVTQNIRRTVWMALLACVAIGLIGFAVLSLISRDLRQLTVAARALGEGILQPDIPTWRRDEIGDLARSFADMQQRLMTDRLTGMPNREAITLRIEDRLQQYRQGLNAHPFAVLFVDLNNFKDINDRWGHETGDRVLMELGERLTASLDAEDLAARYGGDEFVVLLNNVYGRKAAVAARDELERLLALPLTSLPKDGAPPSHLATGASIGLALCPADGNDLDTLVKHADRRMYQNKRGRVVLTER